MTTKIVKSRTWGCVLYPESAKDNWIDIIEDFGLPCLISPLHDSDIDGDGKLKKPHYHIMTVLSSPVANNKPHELFNLIGGVGCEHIKELRYYARYLCHLDSPNKAKYDIHNVISIGGVDYSEIIKSAADDLSTLKDMISFIQTNHITNFSDFISACLDDSNWFKLATTHYTMALNAVINGEYQKARNDIEKRLKDVETAEKRLIKNASFVDSQLDLLTQFEDEKF